MPLKLTGSSHPPQFQLLDVHLEKYKRKPESEWDIDPTAFEVQRLNTSIKDRWEAWTQRGTKTSAQAAVKPSKKEAKDAKAAKGAKVQEEPKTTETAAVEKWNGLCSEYLSAYDFKGSIEFGVPLRFLVALQKALPAHYRAADVVQKLVMPTTEEQKCRFIDLYKRQSVGFPMLYVSYSWTSRVSEVLGYVIRYCEGQAKASEEPLDLDNTFVWIDMLSHNYHRGPTTAEDLAKLKATIGACRETLLCVDEDVRCMTRLWCQWEVMTAVASGGNNKLKVLVYEAPVARFKTAVMAMDIKTGVTSVEGDKQALLRDIGGPLKCLQATEKVRAAIVAAAKAQLADVAALLRPSGKEVPVAVMIAKVSENLHGFTLITSYLWQDREVYDYERIILNRISSLRLFGLLHTVCTAYDPEVLLAGLTTADFTHEHSYLVSRHFLLAVTALGAADRGSATQTPYWPPIPDCAKALNRWIAQDPSLPVDLHTALLS